MPYKNTNDSTNPQRIPQQLWPAARYPLFVPGILPIIGMASGGHGLVFSQQNDIVNIT